MFNQKINLLEELLIEVGDESEEVLKLGVKNPVEIKKETHVSFAAEVTDLSSSNSERTTSQTDNGDPSSQVNNHVMPTTNGKLQPPFKSLMFQAGCLFCKHPVSIDYNC